MQTPDGTSKNRVFQMYYPHLKEVSEELNLQNDSDIIPPFENFYVCVKIFGFLRRILPGPWGQAVSRICHPKPIGVPIMATGASVPSIPFDNAPITGVVPLMVLCNTDP